MCCKRGSGNIKRKSRRALWRKMHLSYNMWVWGEGSPGRRNKLELAQGQEGGGHDQERSTFSAYVTDICLQITKIVLIAGSSPPEVKRKKSEGSWHPLKPLSVSRGSVQFTIHLWSANCFAFKWEFLPIHQATLILNKCHQILEGDT